MSVRNCAPSSAKEIFPTPSYALATASLRQPAWPVTANTRPPDVTVPSAPAAVPAWYTVTPSTPLAASSPAGPVHTQAFV